MELQFTHCEKCNKDYLVGIDKKYIKNSTTSGGKNHLAIGDDEIEKAPYVPMKVPCKNCGELCNIDTIKPESKKKMLGGEDIKNIYDAVEDKMDKKKRIMKEIDDLTSHIKSSKQHDSYDDEVLAFKGTMKNLNEFRKIIRCILDEPNVNGGENKDG